MPSSEVLDHVALVRTDVLEELIASIITVTSHIVLLHSLLWLPVTSKVPSSLILVTLMMEVRHSSKTSVLTGATWRNILKDGIPQCEASFVDIYSDLFSQFSQTEPHRYLNMAAT
jgi:hypothetical protein